MTLAEYLAEVRKRADAATPVVLHEEQYRVAYLNGGIGTLVYDACSRYRGPNHGDFVSRAVDDAVGIALRTDIPLLLAIIEEQAKALEKVCQAADILTDGPDDSDEAMAAALLVDALGAKARIDALIAEREK